MSKLQLTVFPDGGSVPLGKPVFEGVVLIGGTSEPSPTLPGKKRTYFVRLFAEVDCYVQWGAEPVAKDDGTSGRMIGAGVPEYFSIDAGYKLAVIERV